MSVTRTTARRLAAAAVGSSLLLFSAASSLPAYAIKGGTVKVQQPHTDTPTPDNNPQIEGCAVVVELRGVYEDGDGHTGNIKMEHQGSTESGPVKMTPDTKITLKQDKKDNELNASQTFFVVPIEGKPALHLKVTAQDENGQDLQSKVFWMNNCEPGDDGDEGDNGETPEPGNGEAPEPSAEPSTPVTDPSADPSAAETPEHPERVNSGGVADPSGLIFLGVAGAGLLGAAGYGLNRARRKN